MDEKLRYGDAVDAVKRIVTPMIDGTKIEILQLMKDGVDIQLEYFKHLEHRCNVLTVMVVVQYIALALLALCR